MRKKIDFYINDHTDAEYRESVEIPCTLSSLHINVLLDEESRYLTFLFIEDPRGNIRFQKQLGYGDQQIQLGERVDNTSIGGVPGKIGKGQWTFYLYPFTEYVRHLPEKKVKKITLVLSEEEQEITEAIDGSCWISDHMKISPENYRWDKIYKTGQAWYKGDFHTHTRLSDGKETVENAMKKAEKMDLDFYVPTEHNLVHTGWKNTSICILPGTEITTEKGHMNLFGLTKMPDGLRDIILYDGTKQEERALYQIVREAEKNNWITSINHPFLTVWAWKYPDILLDQIKCIEVINDPTYTYAAEANEKAVRFLDQLWMDGHIIYGVGGSDSHNLIDERYEGADLPSVAGDPATYVFCEDLTPKHLLEGVRKGHMCVTRFMKICTEIIADGKIYLPGDRLEDTAENITYRAVIESPGEQPVIFLILDGERKQISVQRKDSGVYFVEISFVLDPKEWHWFRLELRSSADELRGYINPVYRGRKKPMYKTFGEIKVQ